VTWRSALVAVVVSLAAVPAAAPRQGPRATGGDLCLTNPVLPAAKPPHDVRFGITPQAAGSAGVAQQQAAPVDEGQADRALADLRPPGKELVLRLNRLFSGDGDEGIARFAALVDRYGRAGFRTEVQVRYHPAPEQNGDMAAWETFVERAAAELARRPALVAMSVVNEPNLPSSPNTSDGAYRDVEQAIVRGVTMARRTLDAAGRTDVPVGFTFAWRWAPQSDRAFWQTLGAAATPGFRRSLAYVGLQVYPGLVWPPAPLPGRSAGRELVEAAALVRTCFMPQAGLGDDVALWISENGYPTNLGRSEATQAADLRSTLAAVHDVSGTLGITDYRYFNLRDNDSDGTDLFDAVGLLRDDYRRKPAFAILRAAIAAEGTPASPATRAAGAAGRPARRCSGARTLPRLPRGDRWYAPRAARGTARLADHGRRVRVVMRSRSTTRRIAVRMRSRAGRRARLIVLVRCVPA
jgi:hypothetical protein